MDTETNKTLVRNYYEMWNTGDTSKSDDVLAQYYVDHAHPEIATLDAFKEAVIKTRSAFPDFRSRIEFMLAEDDKVALRLSLHRTQNGAEVVSTGLVVFRVAADKLAEQWSVFEPAK